MLFSMITGDIQYEISYRAYTPELTTMTLSHSDPAVKYIYGLGDASGIHVSMVTVNTAADLKSQPISISVPTRLPGMYK